MTRYMRAITLRNMACWVSVLSLSNWQAVEPEPWVGCRWVCLGCRGFSERSRHPQPRFQQSSTDFSASCGVPPDRRGRADRRAVNPPGLSRTFPTSAARTSPTRHSRVTLRVFVITANAVAPPVRAFNYRW